MTEPKFKVAIWYSTIPPIPPQPAAERMLSGAGIGGLACAIMLSRHPNIAVEVYERQSSVREIGAGITIWPRPWKILRELGLEHDLLEYAHGRFADNPSTVIKYVCKDSSGDAHSYSIQGSGFMTFHRADVRKVLLKHLPDSCTLRYSKDLISYLRQTNGVIQLGFLDGTSSNCDLLIGADGIKSSVRRIMLTELAMGRPSHSEEILSCIEPQWSGNLTHRATIPIDVVVAKVPNPDILRHTTQYLGKKGHGIAYPISGGRAVNFAISEVNDELEGTPYAGSWVSSSNQEALRTLCADWDAGMLALIDCIDQSTRWAVHVVKRLPTYVNRGVVLLGDSAHAMLPYQGSGAGQAIEDAYILSTLLSHKATTLQTVDLALHIYDAVRRPFAQEVTRASDRQGRLFMDVKSGEDSAKLQESMKKVGQQLEANLEWCWLSTIDAMKEEAIQTLEESLSVSPK